MATPKIPYGMLFALWLVGWTLRVPVLAAPALANHIADSFGLGEAGIGALTMLPIVAIAFGALPAAWIIPRFGLRTAIAGGMIVMIIASVARGQAPSPMLLFAASIIMGLGIAVFQTALPAATRVWTPTHIALGSAVYLNGMMVGELSGAGLTLPIILPLAGGEWPAALILWSVPITAIAALVLVLRTPDKPTNTPQPSTGNALPRWNDARVWQYGLLLASSAVAFLALNAFMATILRARGETEALEPLLFIFNAMPLLSSFTVLAAPHWIRQRKPMAISAVLSLIGFAGFVLLDGWASWGAAVLTGFASTVKLILLVSLPPAIATGRAVTRLSAGMTLIGFALAFILPLIGGWLADATGITALALAPALMFIAVALLAIGRTPQYPSYE
ncbi:MAG: CynX/NimT family MFS transporter [Pikeienuella sp.]